MGARFAVLIGAFSLAYAFLLFRLYDTQVSRGTYYRAEAASRYFASSFLGPRRGTIYFTDKDGSHVASALNKEFPYVYAVPREVEDSREAANFLSPLTGEPLDELLTKLEKEDDPYEEIAFKITPASAEAIRDRAMKGIYVDTMFERFYPFGSLASHLLGYGGPVETGPGKSGHYGLEEYYNETLAGVPGEVRDGNIVSSVAGGDVYLTIDPAIQREAEKIIGELVVKYRGKGGGIIVEEPATGKILAIASRPNFDPNEYSRFAVNTFFNPLVQAVYEPGSVFKVFTVASAIDARVITPTTSYDDAGHLTLDNRTISNWDGKARGRVTMTEVIEHSINTGAVFVQRKLGREAFRDYLVRFGLGDPTEIDVGGEVPGNLSRLNSRERDIAFATASHGQGVAVTPIGLAAAVSAIANDGILVRPYVNEALGPEPVGRVIERASAEAITDMMVSAVNKAGVARIAGYTVAGKTGTAFVPDFEHGGYAENVVNTYAGFAPSKDPRFVILIKLEEPEGEPLAAQTVVPAFRDLAEFILNYYNVVPDDIGKAANSK